MSFIDLFIIITLCYNIFSGFRSGAVKIVGKTIALFACFAFAKQNHLLLKPYLIAIFNIPPKLQNLISFATSYVLFYIIALLILFLVFKLLKIVHSGLTDNLLGAGIGFIKGSIIILIVIIPLILLKIEWVNQSLIVSETRPIIESIISWMKENNYFNQFLDTIKSNIAKT